MDVLNPELLWIGHRCYRVNIPIDSRDIEERPKASYEEEDDDCFIELEADEDFYEIQTIDGKFQLLIHVPQKFHSQIIGAKGSTKKRLEQETSTQIIVPKIGSKDTNIIIKGNSKKNIISAKNRLDLIVIAGRSKLQFTHFLSIPFITNEIKSSFSHFKEKILNDKGIFGISESLFQNPLKLHLTITTLALMDDEDRAVAATYLQDCKEMIVDPILQGSPLQVEMKGVDIMNDDPSAVDVLYGKVESKELQQIANNVADYFVERGFIQESHENVKLHVTLINSLFLANDDAVEKDSLPKEQRGERVTFDASKILKDFKDFNFGSITIQEIHLSQRYSKGSNGYYEATGILKF